ncbi:unnamed protein product [Moneuplotes crassus]|uniref:Uncharacterized protein n=1 Tax=Euplotes crassus TaxID=5936 RepID=A0AAD1XNS5_EUPCR|nr:unnamed protein product [Moneuplotes crassus]
MDFQGCHLRTFALITASLSIMFCGFYSFGRLHILSYKPFIAFSNCFCVCLSFITNLFFFFKKPDSLNSVLMKILKCFISIH